MLIDGSLLEACEVNLFLESVFLTADLLVTCKHRAVDQLASRCMPGCAGKECNRHVWVWQDLYPPSMRIWMVRRSRLVRWQNSCGRRTHVLPAVTVSSRSCLSSKMLGSQCLCLRSTPVTAPAPPPPRNACANQSVRSVSRELRCADVLTEEVTAASLGGRRGAYPPRWCM